MEEYEHEGSLKMSKPEFIKRYLNGIKCSLVIEKELKYYNFSYYYFFNLSVCAVKFANSYTSVYRDNF